MGAVVSGSLQTATSNKPHNERPSVRDMFNKEFNSTKDSKRNIDLIFNKDSMKNKVINRNNNDNEGVKSSKPTQALQFNPQVFRAKALFMRPVLRRRGMNNVIKRQDNSQLLKEVFRRMDPTSGKITNVNGELEIELKFTPKDNLLLVKVFRGQDLIKSTDSQFLPNPFVVVDLFPATDPGDVTTRKTPVKFSTSDPQFQDVLAFLMNPDDVSHMKLRFTVLDKVQSWQEDFMGEVLIDLHTVDDLEIGDCTWYQLSPKTDITYCGTLETNVRFVPPSSLQVTLKRANQLKPCNENDLTSNPYARLFVTTAPTTFQTSVHYHTSDPVWMESFVFDVQTSDFLKAFLVINIFSKDNHGQADQRLGDVHIHLANLDFSKGSVEKEYLLKDLHNAGWSRSGRTDSELSAEFREAMKAHLMYGIPKSIFKKHESGSRVVISCKSRRAQKSACIIVQNGVVVG